MAYSHQLERRFGLPARSILDAINSSNRTLVAVKGAVAQEQLKRYLRGLKRSRAIQDFGSVDVDGKPDFWVKFRGRKYLIECKNVQKNLRRGEMTVDFMRTRYQKTGKPSARFYSKSEFEVLAACVFNQTGEWNFRFIATARLDRHPSYADRLTNKVSLGPSTRYHKHWQDDLRSALKMVR